MAIKTIILRPTASSITNIVNSGNLGITSTPSNVANENLYQLVAETVADDDATYITLSNTGDKLKLEYFLETNITNITGITVYCRARSDGTSYAGSIGMEVEVNGNLNASNQDHPELSPGISAWENYTIDMISAYNETMDFLEILNSVSNTRKITLVCGVGGSINSSNKNTVKSVDYTQVYIELTCGEPDEETSSLYLRENGAWTATNGIIYQKINNSWTVTTTDVFQEGDIYELVTEE